MPYTVDIGGAPAAEPCAQLGQTPDFHSVNVFEVAAYHLAIVARYGLPPKGCKLTTHANRHDFGTYVSLVLHVTDENSEAASDYAEAVEEGLGTWLEAGFAPPVTYEGSVATIPRADPAELVIGALHTTRPSPDGSFVGEDFATIHRNLTAAFPEQAEEAAKRLVAA